MLKGDNLNRCSEKENEALEMAIQALEQEPTDEYMCGYNKGFDEGVEEGIKATVEPCEDAVSREAVIEAVRNGCLEFRGIYSNCVELINKLPSVILQRKSNADEKHVGNTLDMRCDDAVSREACLMCLTGEFVPDKEYKPEELIAVFSKRIKTLPPVTVRQTGEWEQDETDNSITCNRCGCHLWANDIMDGNAHFCPNCGADMRD